MSRVFTCTVCGKVFEKEKFLHKYCSPECRRKADMEHCKAWRDNNRERLTATQRARRARCKKNAELITPITKICPMCGVQFVATRAYHKYCTPTCSNKAYKEMHKAERAAHDKMRRLSKAEKKSLQITGATLHDPTFKAVDLELVAQRRKAIKEWLARTFPRYHVPVPDELKGCKDIEKWLDWIFEVK